MKPLLSKATYPTGHTMCVLGECAVFKGSLTRRLSYCMWTCVAAAVHMVTNCPYVCNRCALETWGAMPQATSSPGPSLLTWQSEHCICKSVSCWNAHTLLYLPPVRLTVLTKYINSSHTFFQLCYEMLMKRTSMISAAPVCSWEWHINCVIWGENVFWACKVL